MRDFYIVEYGDDGPMRRQMGSARQVIDYSIKYNMATHNQGPNETLLNIVAALLDRATASAQDMLELADLPGLDTEEF